MTSEAVEQRVDPVVALQDRLGVDEVEARDIASIKLRVCKEAGELIGKSEFSFGDLVAVDIPEHKEMADEIIDEIATGLEAGNPKDTVLRNAFGAGLRVRDDSMPDKLARVAQPDTNPAGPKKK